MMWLIFEQLQVFRCDQGFHCLPFALYLLDVFVCDKTTPHYSNFKITMMILSFRTDMPGQTVQTQIRLLLEEQSDQGLHCLPFGLDSLLYGRAT